MGFFKTTKEKLVEEKLKSSIKLNKEKTELIKLRKEEIIRKKEEDNQKKMQYNPLNKVKEPKLSEIRKNNRLFNSNNQKRK